MLRSEGERDLSIFGDLDDLRQLDGEASGLLKIRDRQNPEAGGCDQDLALVDSGSL